MYYRSSTSEKYKAARKTCSIQCVNPTWITDSLERGYALPHDLYPVKKSTSTPTKGGEQENPDFSTISIIAPVSRQSYKSVLEETTNVTVSERTIEVPVSGLKRKSTVQLVCGLTIMLYYIYISDPQREDHNDLVNNIDLKQVKNAGAFLDGCSVSIVSSFV